jgi:hypothetical protein
MPLDPLASPLPIASTVTRRGPDQPGLACLLAHGGRVRLGLCIEWYRSPMNHKSPVRLRVVVAAAALAWLGFGGTAVAQHWPSEPVALAGGHLLLAGDVSATFGSEDPGWFTYTNYETSALRRVRAGLTIEARVSRHLSFLTEIRAETGTGVTPYAWFVRLTPFENGLVDIQAGRIPPVFGTYARRAYPQDNPLIGDPLGYQYLTSIRPDAVPATADDLLRMRGRGWRVRYPIGNPSPDAGVPMVAASPWDTGIQVRAGQRTLEGALAFTLGSLSYPLVKNDNGGGQVAGRLAWQPLTGLVLGVSAARGAFVSGVVREARPDIPDQHYDERAIGIDAETSWGRWLLRGEFVANSWTLPEVSEPRIADPLESRTWYLETKVRLRPGLFVAARGSQLRFSTIRGSAGPRTWDADVTRVEVGAGYTIRRGLLVKASLSSNRRDGGAIREDHLAGVQALFWF